MTTQRYRTSNLRCPNCGEDKPDVGECITEGVGPSECPSPDDVTICLQCAAVFSFGDFYNGVPADPDMYASMPTDVRNGFREAAGGKEPWLYVPP